MAHVFVVGIICLSLVILFVRQIARQLRSGKVRPRGSTEYKTRENNPVWYWSSVGAQLAFILIAVYSFLLAVLKATK